MAYFHVILDGSGICIPLDADTEHHFGFADPEEKDRPIIGFFTSRTVRASNREDAIEAAKSLVLKQWSKPPLVKLNKGALPELIADQVIQISLTRYLRESLKPNQGYTFYSDVADDADEKF
ncbi:MAG TPA: hypothetical protein VGG10_00540 [Rhizomicrobium sp.]|jgi:hypothetical protein